MKSTKRRIIILKDLKSPHIEQAFFILKDAAYDGHSAVYEAERIIEEYVFPSPCPQKSKEKKLPDYIPFAVAAALAMLAGVVAVVINMM